MGNKGLFITLEGPDGSGKTTQLRLLQDWFATQDISFVFTREPGGTRIGEAIRDVLHDCANVEMAAHTEILLYSASRAQLVAELIKPALAEGKTVICDRYYDSTYAYQGYGRGLSLEILRMITDFAIQGLTPDLTFYLDVSSELGLQRREHGGEEMNRLDLEALDFHRKVRAGYLALAQAEPERWRVLDATGSIDEVQSTLRTLINESLLRI